MSTFHPTIHLTRAEVAPAVGSFFVGRTNELAALRMALVVNNDKLAFVSGARGMGKTSLVQMFCHSAGESFPGGIEYIYAHADWNPQMFEFRSLDPSRKSLVVLDEADHLRARDLAGVEEVLAKYPRLSAIVVASRRPRNISSGVIVNLSSFNKDEWEMLLRTRLTAYDPQGAQEFYRRVRGHPMMLSFGTSTVREGLLSWQALLKNFEAFEQSGILGPDGLPYAPSISVPEAIVEVCTHLEEELYRAVVANPDLIYKISPRDFERLVAELLDRQGYEITLTPPSKDGGFDMYAAKSTELGQFLFLVECKKYARERPVQVDIVRALYGTVQAKKATAGIVVTTSSFTRGAKQFQQKLKHQLHLRDYVNLRRWLSNVYSAKDPTLRSNGPPTVTTDPNW
jgi:restriction system protein